MGMPWRRPRWWPRRTKPPDWDRLAVVIATIQLATDLITRSGR